MAWRIIDTTSPYITVYAMDDENDVSDLPTDGGIGSIAVCMPSADGSGIGRVTYMLNSSLQWVK